MTDAAIPIAAPLSSRRSWVSKLRGKGVPWVSVIIFALILVAAIGGEAVAPHDPNELNLGAAFRPPSWLPGGSLNYLLGTDNLGRDILSRIIAGARISMITSFYAIIFAGGVGALVGMTAGYFGKVIDAIIMRLVDIQMSIPALALALVIAAVLSPSLSTVIIVISLTYWTWYARIIRGEIMSLKERDYVALAKVAGVSTPMIFFRHLLPNIMNTLAGARNPSGRPGHHFRGFAEFPRSRHSKSRRLMGPDAGRCPRIHHQRLVGHYVAGRSHHAGLSVGQSDRRLVA